MVVKIGITEKEINTIRFLKIITDYELEALQGLEDKRGLTESEEERLYQMIIAQGFFHKVQGVIDNQIDIGGSYLENAPEISVKIPRALEEHIKVQERQRKRDRERLNDIGIHIDIFQSESIADEIEK